LSHVSDSVLAQQDTISQSEVFYIVAVGRKCARALTFESLRKRIHVRRRIHVRSRIQVRRRIQDTCTRALTF